MNVECSHCGLQVPAGEIDGERELQFCCEGCRAVHAAIIAGGFEDYYRRRGEQKPRRAAGAEVPGYQLLDAPAFQEAACEDLPSGCRRVELGIDGLHCGACVWLLERMPRVTRGLHASRVNLAKRTIELDWVPGDVALSDIARSLGRLGYGLRPGRGAADREARRADDRRWIVRIAVAAAIAGNIMGISFALYGGMFTGIDPVYQAFLRWTSLVLVVVALAWPGRVFLRGAWAALRAGTTHMDQPVAIGLVIGTVAGFYTTLTGGHETWFEAVSMLVLLLLVGRWLQHRSQRQAQDAVERLFSLAPSSACRVVEGRLEELPSEALSPGDLVRVRAGDIVPADGEVTRGAASVDRSLLTGESRPVRVRTAEAVHAGERCLDGTFDARVARSGAETRIASILRSAAAHAAARPRIVQAADRLAGWFVAAVMALAIVTFLVWVQDGWTVAVDRTVALLIVTCPCALGLATPLAIVAALGRAARRGMLIKGGDVLETLSRPGTLLLDKTGTVTKGKVRVLEVIGEASVVEAAAAVERSSGHPSARAIVRRSEKDGLASDVLEHAGQGIEGTVDGSRYHIGSRRWMDTVVSAWNPDRSTCLQRAEAIGGSDVWVARDGVVEACIIVGDPVRTEAAGVVARMTSAGWRLGLVSGDSRTIAEAVAANVGMDASMVTAEAMPEQKVAVVQAQATHPVVMVGDGVNDAAAMGAADVGVAVHGGAEAALSTADVCLAGDGLAGVESLLVVARQTMRRIRLNISVSIAWNAAFAGLAMVGLIGPILAAVLMPLSSASVVMLSARGTR